MLRLICALTILMLTSLPAGADEQPVKYVVLVSVDGLAGSYLTDPRAQMPNLRRIAAEGAAAEGMLTSFPSSTWPAHTSMITGVQPARHGVIGNTVWNRKTNEGLTYIGDPVLTKSEAVRAPTLYDVAHQAGLSTAGVIWPCTNGADTLDWMIPDSGDAEMHARYTTPGLVDDLAQAGIDISQLGEWGWSKKHSTERDALYTQVALHLLTQHKVNLILLHLITPDGVEHAYGPKTPAVYEAIAESDKQIGAIWDALQQPPFAGQSALFVVSDHGFAPFEKYVRPNVVLRDLGLIEIDDKGDVTKRQAWCVSQGGSAFVYVMDDEHRSEILKTITPKLAEVEGVVEVVSPDEYETLGLPDPAENPEAPDLVLMTGPGYNFVGSVKGPVVSGAGGQKGNHGHDPRPEFMHALFVAAGAGIKPGAKLDVINNVDVAPTIARLLGLTFDANGRVLTEALTP